MAKIKRFNKPSESVFFEWMFSRIKYFPSRMITNIRYFFGDCGEASYSLRHKQPIRFGVFPEWFRKLINIYKIK